ncbi:MAG: hypothetical protein HY664_02320 [Chloroflexi bacterium]|nr:hypothetical protein [Chloroflexota bacterium]
MNLFNKVLVITLTIISILFWVGVVSVAVFFSGDLITRLKDTVGDLGPSLSVWAQAMIGLVAAIFILLSLLLLLAEISPPRAAHIPLVGVTSGTAFLTAQAIIQRIKNDVQGLPQVLEVKPTVTVRSKMVDIRLDLHTEPIADVSAKTEEVCRIVRDTVENKIGIKLRQLTVRVHHQSLPPQVTVLPKETRTGEPTPEGSRDVVIVPESQQDLRET